MTDVACLWHYVIDGFNANTSDIIAAYVVWLKTKHDIFLIVYYFTQHTMHHNIVKAYIAEQTNVSTAKNTEPTDGTFNCPLLKSIHDNAH